MKQILALTVLVLGFQAVHAEEQRSPGATAVPTAEQPVAAEAKSFFETRTLEDLQQLVHVDAQSFESSDLSFGEG